MILKPPHLLLATLATAAAPFAASAQVLYPIDVPNWNFEVDRSDQGGDLADGLDIYMAPLEQDWYQYNVKTNGGPQRYWNPSAVPVTGPRFVDSGFGGNAHEGNHVAIAITRYNDDRHPDGTNLNGSQGPEYPATYVRDFEAIAQVLEDVPFDPAETYQLTVAVGHPPGDPADPEYGTKTYEWNGYMVQLLAGGYELNEDEGGSLSAYEPTIYDGTVIAEDNNSTPIAVNTFELITVTYSPGDLTPEEEAALEGLPLQIRLCALENPLDHSTQSIVAFDSVVLEGPPAPPTLTITPPGEGETDYTFDWISRAGRQYDLLSSSDLTAAIDTWTTVTSGIAGTSDLDPVSTTAAPDGAERYYVIDDVPAP